LKTQETDGYTAIQIGFGSKKSSKLTKPLVGHLKKSGERSPLFLREIRLEDEAELPQVGETLKVAEILAPGDIVWVTGTSKGKGFAGGVKRYGFRGGPKTHGQSDRERAPGSIGQTTTPGRVYRGKRMAGNMGNEQVTVKNLVVVSVNPEEKTIMLAGLVPGIMGSYVKVVKMGSKKKFTPLLPNPVEQAKLDAEAAKAEEEAEKAAAEVAAASSSEASEGVAEVTEVSETVTAEPGQAAPVAEEAPATTESEAAPTENTEETKEEGK
jgi:large subunit ribosomal protein L3